MKIFKKNISIKYFYIICAVIALLISFVLYKTYAMFTVNTNSGNDTTANKTYNFIIGEEKNRNFTVLANSIYSFNALLKNTSNNPIYFEIYYVSSDDLTNVIIAEVVQDKNQTPVALNTGINLNANEQRIVPLVIVNNDSANKNITINVAKGFVGNPIVYDANNDPNGVKITATYNLRDVTNNRSFNMDDCIAENNGTELYCAMR